MDLRETRKRLIAAHEILESSTVGRKEFEALRRLLAGINADVDRRLESVSKAWRKVDQVKKGEVVDLSAEALPEQTEEERKRKKALLLFLRRWRGLRGVVKKVQAEIERGEQGKTRAPKEQVKGLGKSLFLAKSAFAALGALAVAIVGSYFYVRSQQRSVPSSQPAVRETMVDEQLLSDEDALAYWVIEGDVAVDSSGRQATWSVHIHQENTQTRQRGDDIPASGALVTAELRSSAGTKTLAGTVETDGWVRWSEPLPSEETSLYVTSVTGELPWSKTSQLAWKDQPLATARPGR